MANIAVPQRYSGTKLRAGYHQLMNVPAHVPDKVDRAILAHLQRDGRIANVDLAGYEQLLLDQVLAVPDVTEARSTFAIRTVLSRGSLPLEHWR